jgi:hypothetical protein
MSMRERFASMLNYVRNYRSHYRFRHLVVALVVIVVVFVVGSVIASIIGNMYDFWDDDADRGATTVARDTFGDKFAQVRYLDQGWDRSESLWFYNVTQGSNVVPYDFFMVLEKPGTTELLRSNENVNSRYRYLPRKATFGNPDGLPVGWVKDSYRGREFLGFTCAACHTSQVNYNGIAIRIDGGPTMADMDRFIYDLLISLDSAGAPTSSTHARFVKNVIARGNYDSEAEIMADMNTYRRRLGMYYIANHPQYPYGYARLDAFGRIYNRVLEHVISGDAFREVLNELVVDKRISEDEFKAIANNQLVKNILTGQDRDHLYERIEGALSLKQQLYMRNKIFNKPNAPVSYPFLWDIPQHDFVQWNGLASNAGLGPVGRNTGEAIGMFATLDWSRKPGFSLSSLISGQGFSASHISYKSSVEVGNLRKIERQMTRLESPVWPESILPPIDRARAARGEHLFVRHCAECHAEIDRTDPHRRVVAHISSLDDVGTDSSMAWNSVHFAGRSGILRNQYIGTGVGDILLDTRAPVAELLTKVTIGVVATPNPDHWWLRRGYDWARELGAAFFSNEIKPSIRRGKYNPDNTVDPYASIVSYKGRSLNGIWATAPYLHNGSVPTLYDLLLPPRLKGDTSAGPFRPDTFRVGSREFDPALVGFKTSGYDGFKFETRLRGNRNGGHEYPPRCVAAPAAKGAAKGAAKAPPKAEEKPPLAPPFDPPTEDIKPPCGLTHEDRLDLVEYLKTL